MLTSVILFCWLGIWVAYSLLQNRFIFPIILVLHVPHVTRFTKHVCNKVFFSQQFGHKIGEGRFRGKALPTYVYPDCLFQAIWTIINASLRDYLNPKMSAASFFFFFFGLVISTAIFLQFNGSPWAKCNFSVFILPLGLQGDFDRLAVCKMVWRCLRCMGLVREDNIFHNSNFKEFFLFVIEWCL